MTEPNSQYGRLQGSGEVQGEALLSETSPPTCTVIQSCVSDALNESRTAIGSSLSSLPVTSTSLEDVLNEIISYASKAHQVPTAKDTVFSLHEPIKPDLSLLESSERLSASWELSEFHQHEDIPVSSTRNTFTKNVGNARIDDSTKAQNRATCNETEGEMSFGDLPVDYRGSDKETMKQAFSPKENGFQSSNSENFNETPDHTLISAEDSSDWTITNKRVYIEHTGTPNMELMHTLASSTSQPEGVGANLKKSTLWTPDIPSSLSHIQRQILKNPLLLTNSRSSFHDSHQEQLESVSSLLDDQSNGEDISHAVGGEADDWKNERARLLAEAQLMRRALEESKVARRALRLQIKKLQEDLLLTQSALDAKMNDERQKRSGIEFTHSTVLPTIGSSDKKVLSARSAGSLYLGEKGRLRQPKTNSDDIISRNESSSTEIEENHSDSEVVNLDLRGIPDFLLPFCRENSKELYNAQRLAKNKSDLSHKLFTRCALLELELKDVLSLLSAPLSKSKQTIESLQMNALRLALHPKQKDVVLPDNLTATGALKTSKELSSKHVKDLEAMLIESRAQALSFKAQLQFTESAFVQKSQLAEELMSELEKLKLVVKTLEHGGKVEEKVQNQKHNTGSVIEDKIFDLFHSSQSESFSVPDITACKSCGLTYEEVLSSCKKAVLKRDCMISKTTKALHERDEAINEWRVHSETLAANLAESRSEAARFACSLKESQYQIQGLKDALQQHTEQASECQKAIFDISWDSHSHQEGMLADMGQSLLLRQLLKEQRAWREQKLSSMFSRNVIALYRFVSELESYVESMVQQRLEGDTDMASFILSALKSSVRTALHEMQSMPQIQDQEYLPIGVSEEKIAEAANAVFKVGELLEEQQARSMASEWTPSY